MKPSDTTAVESWVLSQLPATFMALHLRAASTFGDCGGKWYRAVDRALQRLRKRGLAETFRDKGRSTWRQKGPQ